MKRRAFIIICTTYFIFANYDFNGETAILGYIDKIVVNGSQITIIGWSGSVEPDNIISSVSIRFEDKLILEDEFSRICRPDVVKATARSDWLFSGWEIKATIADYSSDKPLIVKAKLDNGKESVLRTKKTSKQSPRDYYFFSPYAYGLLNHFFQIFLFLSILTIFIVSPYKYTKLVISNNDRLKAREPWLYRIIFFLICLSGTKILLMKFSLTVYTNYFAIIFSCFISYIAVQKHIPANHDSDNHSFYKEFLSSIAILMLYFGWLYGNGPILPAHDPIAVPTFASILNQKFSLSEYYADVKSNASLYPPGFSLLLSFAYVLLDDIGVLILFKIICVLSIGLIPFSWAWLAKRIFNIPFSLFAVALCFYVAGYGIERTLTYTLPLAGKNAQIFMLLIFPVFFVYLSTLSGYKFFQLISLSFVFFGLILIHYSAIYLAFSLTLALFLVEFFKNPHITARKATQFLSVAFVLFFGVAIFVIFSYDSFSNLRNSLDRPYNFIIAFSSFYDLFFGVNTQLLSTFNLPVFQTVVASPIRGYYLIFSVLFSAITTILLRDKLTKTYASSILICSSSFFISILIGAALSCGIIPSNLSIDFFRWFIFPLQIGVIACALLSAYVILNCLERRISISIFTIFLISPTVVFLIDTIHIKKSVDFSAISSSELRRMKHSISPGNGGCEVIAQNSAVLEGITYVQRHKIIEYVEMLTGCRLIAGSWLHGPSTRWDPKTNSPVLGMLESFPKDKYLYFIGSPDEFKQYGKDFKWEREGCLLDGEISIWKLISFK